MKTEPKTFAVGSPLRIAVAEALRRGPASRTVGDSPTAEAIAMKFAADPEGAPRDLDQRLGRRARQERVVEHAEAVAGRRHDSAVRREQRSLERDARAGAGE